MQYGAHTGHIPAPVAGPDFPGGSLTLEKTRDIIDEAVELHQSGRLGEAAAIYQQVLQVDPDDYSALYLLGVIAHQQRDEDGAIELLERATKADPGRADPHNVLGLACKRRGKFDEARHHLQTAVELDPTSAQAHHNLGTIFADREQLTEAIKSYRRAIALDPEYVNTHYRLGMALADDRAFETALEHLQRALALNQGFVRGLRGWRGCFKSWTGATMRWRRSKACCDCEPMIRKRTAAWGASCIARRDFPRLGKPTRKRSN